MTPSLFRPAALSACLLLAVSGLAACTRSTAADATADALPPAAPPSTQDLVARGDYLVRIAGCNDCHTPAYGERNGEVPREEWLLGSPLGFLGPWGTTYAANLRLKAAEMDEAAWLDYTGKLHTRPTMPDFNVRAMTAEDRLAIYHLLRELGPAGQKAPDYLPPGQTPPPPYLEMVLPPAE